MNTRREFLRAAGGATVVSLSGVAPAFLVRASASQLAAKKGETILVVVQLSGGNDGLNTVVPYADDAYHKNRFTLRIAKDAVHKLDDYLGLHPAMKGMAELYQQKKLAIVQGVGYPNPNRSHFESMDIWHTARQKQDRRAVGWLGRYLDESAAARRGTDVAALHLGSERQPLALAALDVQVPSVRSLDRFRLQDGGDAELRKTVETLAGVKRAARSELLDFIQANATAAIASSKRISEALGRYKTSVAYPSTGLAQSLKSVAQLIDAGLSTRVYYVALDGFDTHSEQKDAHAGLVGELSGALAAFMSDLAEHGHSNRVLVASFSEFGRRVRENASRGTDHGAAAPMFLAGGRVKPGVIGKHPSLTDLDDGDLKHHTDFRQVYAAILRDWLGWKTETILDGKYEPLPIIAT
jgi:uncharacterized protein (DUF1501 family)